MTPAHSLLDAEHAAFLQSDGLSINAASSGNDGFANLARCVGCRVSPARDRITLLLAAAPATDFLADIARNGCIAAVFNMPSSHRTVQFKGTDARRESLIAGDLERIRRFRETFSVEVSSLGFPLLGAHAVLAAPDEDLVAVSFAPLAAFSQTPGPNAGAPLVPSS